VLRGRRGSFLGQVWLIGQARSGNGLIESAGNRSESSSNRAQILIAAPACVVSDVPTLCPQSAAIGGASNLFRMIEEAQFLGDLGTPEA
jgi:hypothetical protein